MSFLIPEVEERVRLSAVIQRLEKFRNDIGFKNSPPQGVCIQVRGSEDVQEPAQQSGVEEIEFRAISPDACPGCGSRAEEDTPESFAEGR